ncbi:glycosyltransferase family 2 protein [Chloroflexota bacterium]
MAERASQRIYPRLDTMQDTQLTEEFRSSQDNRSRIIAALPAYNEEKYIGTVVLKAKQYVDEVIVVDDGSMDKTAYVAGLAGATVVSHEENKGYGASIQTILGEAKKKYPDVLVLFDADSQHDPGDIPAVVQPILEGYDIVIGSRKLQKDNIPLYRRFGQNLLFRSSRFLSKTNLSDSESGFRAFSLKAINELNLSQSGMAVSAETILLAAEKGFRITEVPISVTYTKDGSTLNPITHGLGNLAWIITMISERRPLFFFGISGIILIVLGILKDNIPILFWRIDSYRYCSDICINVNYWRI